MLINSNCTSLLLHRINIAQHSNTHVHIKIDLIQKHFFFLSKIKLNKEIIDCQHKMV